MADERIIYFLRHGMTTANQKRLYCGWSDPPLLSSEELRLSQLGVSEDIDAVFASDSIRSLRTAQLLFPNVRIRETMLLREMNFGDFEGKSYEQLKSSPDYRWWINDLQKNFAKNGETPQTFHSRIITFWNELSEIEFKAAAVVTHSGWMRGWLRNIGKNSEVEWNIPFGGGYKAALTNRGGELICTSLQEVILTEKHNG
ncbi:histidine phosphatase family protein [Alteribacillus sp. HJP-4]|uniref:histidine phosphatase family protein n=1 Tax=Alteribacillus sp. HJP-4 TaxID=2775394 RepID=UPI0035CCEF1D